MTMHVPNGLVGNFTIVRMLRSSCHLCSSARQEVAGTQNLHPVNADATCKTSLSFDITQNGVFPYFVCGMTLTSKTMKVELLKPAYTPTTAQDSGSILLETLLTLTGEDSLREDSLWHTAVMDHLLQFKLFTYLRGILLQVVLFFLYLSWFV